MSVKLVEYASRMVNSGPPRLEELLIVIYGDKKVGKSTFASRFPNVLFLDFEDALRSVILQDGTRPDQVSISRWEGDGVDSLSFWMDALKDPDINKTYDTVVIDGLNSAYGLLRKSVLGEKRVQDENEGDLSYGKGRRLINSRWHDWFSDLRRMPYGVVLTAHEKPRTVTVLGSERDKFVPLVDGSTKESAWDTIMPSVDIIIRATKVQTKNGLEHRMYTKGTQEFEACDPTPDGRLPNDRPLSYNALKKAYYKE